MKKLFLLCIVLVSCDATCNMTARECHDMCYPRKVDRYIASGCYCEGSTTPEVKK